MRTIGADLGGTWLRLCLTDPLRGVLLRLRVPALPLDRLAPAFREALAKERFPRPDLLVLGSTGIWSASRRAAAQRSLKGLARRVLVVSDIELAQAAAFAGGPGILVVGGTGSVAFGRDGRGKSLRAGGLGALLGDEGSAFWVGRQALRDPSLRRKLGARGDLGVVHAPRPAAAVASLAPAVFRLAARDEGFARIRSQAARHLAGLAAEVRAGLPFRGPAPVSWRGGLFHDPRFLSGFLAALADMGGFAPRPALLEAEVAAALLPPHVLLGRA
ncbi:MAG: hypothetical protein HY924_05740 [Elusimicrobia bacterium]|nr:hypothetical protein [Elusimicrobiota bacterium]